MKMSKGELVLWFREGKTEGLWERFVFT